MVPFIFLGANNSLFFIFIITEHELWPSTLQKMLNKCNKKLHTHLVAATGFCCSSSELSPALSESVSPVAKNLDIFALASLSD